MKIILHSSGSFNSEKLRLKEGLSRKLLLFIYVFNSLIFNYIINQKSLIEITLKKTFNILGNWAGVHLDGNEHYTEKLVEKQNKVTFLITH